MHIKDILSLVFLLASFFANGVYGQNLVPNGNFERHVDFYKTPITNLGHIELLTGWKGDLTHLIPAYCHRDIVKRFGQERMKLGGYINFDTLDLIEGDAMVKLFYHENDVTWDTGAAGYIQTKLISPLELGEVYELSMWVLSKYNPAADTMSYTHMGMYLTREQLWVKDQDRIVTDYYFGGKLIPGEWTEIKWYIRALCPLQYLTIGVFRDWEFPSLFRQIFNPVAFFADKVSIRKIEEDSLSADIHPTPYCEYYEKEQKLRILESVTSLDIQYESNAHELDEVDKMQLDSFYTANLERKKKIFVIIGHTDDQAADNMALSKARATSAAMYLQDKYKINPLTTLTYGLGSGYPVADNKTTAGRLRNRRITIRTSDLDISQVIYRKGLEHLQIDDLENAHAQFAKWLRVAPLEKRIAMVVDPRIQQLKQTRYWTSLIDIIRKGYASYPAARDAYFVDSLMLEDQLYRTPDHFTLSGMIEEIDTVRLRPVGFNEASFQLHHASNFTAIRNYLERAGYPEIKNVGRRPARAVGFVLLHQFDSLTFERWLPIVEQRCIGGEGEWDIFAMMTDKLCILKNIPQVYGTQYARDETGGLVLYTIDNIEAVNKRRARLGMLPTTTVE